MEDAPAFCFLSSPFDPAPTRLSYAELVRRSGAAAAWMTATTGADDLVILLLPTGPEAVCGVFGSILAGRPATLLPLPRHRRDRRALDRLEGVLTSLDRRCHLVVPDGGRQALSESASDRPALAEAIAAAHEAGTFLAGGTAFASPPAAPDDLAYVQFTSGSTAAPRGVMLSHRALLANLEVIAKVFDPERPLRTLSWLPLHHDMGLVGHLLQPVYLGGQSLLADPGVFAGDPLDWLRAMDHWKIGVSGAPPFAFARAARALETLSPDARADVADLSRLRVLYMGAEPVGEDLLRRFTRLCAPLGLAPGVPLPCYGLAEISLFAAGSKWNGGPLRYPLPSGIEARVAEPVGGAELPPGREGEIWLAGESLASGYLDDPEASAATFVHRDGRRWLRTGDQGVLTPDGLIPHGRLKDVIIHRGANLHATDLEAAARAADPRLAAATMAAVPAAGPDGEGVALLIERRPHQGAGSSAERDALAQAAARAVSAAGDGIHTRVLFLTPGTLPRTTSGKLVRHMAAKELREGRLETAAGPPRRSPVATVTGSEPVAVIGMACRFPGADDPESFWQALEQGRDLIREVPPDRWDVDAYYDPRPAMPGKMNTRWGGFIDGIDLFDAGFFGISAPEAAEMDPQQRLALETGWRAFEQAGLGRDTLAGSATGVFVGLSTQDYMHLQIRQRGGLEQYNAWSGLGSAGSIAANRISYLLDLRGPSMAVDTACSSSLTTVQLAVDSLRRGACDHALAGGVSLILSPGTTIALSQFHMMSGDGRCKVFDLAADGYVRSEGCGFVVLKKLSDARRDGDRVWAVIRGGALAQDGRSAGITAPNPEAQKALLEAALANAGTRPHEVGLIEAHGTGTIAGDPAEFGVIAQVYGRVAGGHCSVVSVKANTGHLEAAAGIASLIRVVGVLNRGVIPPQIHFKECNPLVVVKGTRLDIPTEAQPWPSGDGKPRVAALSSFGFGGALAHMVVEQGDPAPEPYNDGAPYLIPLSARDPEALADLAAELRRHLATERPALRAVAHTLGARRSHFPRRAAITASSLAELDGALSRLPAAATISGVPKVAFLFSGQGAQFVGMGLDLADRFPLFRAALESCAATIAEAAPKAPGLREILTDPEKLDSLAFLQPALCAVELALAALWRGFGIRPAVVLGHSLGAYAAATCAGAVTAESALRLVTRRAALMAAHVKEQGGMISVAATPADLMDFALDGVETAAVNGPASTVLGGSLAAIEAAGRILGREGLAWRRLRTPQAFHTTLMDPVLSPFEAAAAEIDWTAAEIPWISDLTGALMTDAPNAAYWRDHLRRPVAFGAALDTLAKIEISHVIEIGPGRGLCALALPAMDDKTTVLPGLPDGGDGARAILETCGRLYADGANPDWTGVLGVDDAPPAPLPLPGHPLRRKRHWFTVAPLAAGAAPSATPRASAAPPGRFGIDWDDQGTPTNDGPEADTHWIVVGDGRGLGAALSRDLAARGLDTYHLLPHPDLPPGKAPRRRKEGAGEASCLRLAPADFLDGNAMGRALGLVMTDFARADAQHWRVVWTGSLDAADPEGLVAGTLDMDQETHGPGALTALVQGLLHTARSGRLWLLTQGAQTVSGDPTLPRVGQMPSWGFGTTLFLEHPEMRGGLLDLDPARPAADQAPDLPGALRRAEGFTALRGGRLLAQRLIRVTAAQETVRLSLREEGTYLITGGLGGLGLATAERLAERGARHLVLAGRRGLPARDLWEDPDLDATTRDRIAAVKRLESRGARVTVHALDVADPEALRNLLRKLDADGPPLRGIVHAAGVNWFSRIAEQDVLRLSETMRIKVAAAWTLHEATRDKDLDLFVLYSSVSALWGSVDLSHYSAANLFLDGLARLRHCQGLPATCIDWGPWAEVGMSAKPREMAVLNRLGLRPMPPAAALDALEELVASGAPQTVVADIDWRAFRQFVNYSTAPAFFGRVMEATPGDGPAPLGGEAIAKSLRQAGPAEAMDRLIGLIRRELAVVIFLPGSEEPDLDQRFNLMGMDSLTAIAFALRLEAVAGEKLPPTLAYNYPTIRAVAEHLYGMIRGEAAAAPETPQAVEIPAWKSWLPTAPVTPAARPLIYTFPYAGAGAAAYPGWPEALAGEATVCPVALPGRDSRRGEPPARAMADLVGPLAEALDGHLAQLGADQSFLLYGHSLGGLIAYETALELVRRGTRHPIALVLSCCLPHPAPPEA
ncbi:hypothetical protein CWS72_14585, partial [Telmatospirillum siberiense]